jgi:hypothetical protein
VRRRASTQQAFDEVRFGATRTLNLRDGLPSADEAVRRAEGWLRAKQVERAGEVLVVTGRGNASLDGVPVIRSEVRRLLTRLKRQGVVADVREHTPGSVVVKLAPLKALFEAAAVARAPREVPAPTRRDDALGALSPETVAALRRLAARVLESLGVVAPTDEMLASEVRRQFSLLARGAADEVTVLGAARRALAEFDEAD